MAVDVFQETLWFVGPGRAKRKRYCGTKPQNSRSEI